MFLCGQCSELAGAGGIEPPNAGIKIPHECWKFAGFSLGVLANLPDHINTLRPFWRTLLLSRDPGSDRLTRAPVVQNQRVCYDNPMGFGNGQIALMPGDNCNVVNLKGVRPFPVYHQTRRQVVVDQIVEWVGIMVGLTVMASLAASILRMMGYWFW
jgi:hypothetical protein